ncbi:MAG: hypothetical protein PHC49_04595 [Desulfuromonadaceae bacterium]|nr:hypothetical protein [Desulfuromonadaceae bacterium]
MFLTPLIDEGFNSVAPPSSRCHGKLERRGEITGFDHRPNFPTADAQDSSDFAIF